MMNKVLVSIIFLLLWGCSTTQLESPRSIESCCQEQVGFDNLDYGEPMVCDFTTNRVGYALGFVCAWRQPAWVAYRLTTNEATTLSVRRTNKFKDDVGVPGSASLGDYLHSGYDRGHLAPAADMGWSSLAMDESFFMSNMSPQTPSFNRGVWKELETHLRKYAASGNNIFIYTGPMFQERSFTNSIGKSSVLVPTAFYKAVYNENPTNEAMIAFLVPNVGTTNSISTFALTIDELEGILNMDFFKDIPIEKQDELESKLELDRWGLKNK